MLMLRAAAVGIRRGDMVDLLLDNGARMDADTWTRSICFADVVVPATCVLSGSSGVLGMRPLRARV